MTQSPHLVIIVPSGDIGGVVVLSSLVARAAGARGHRCTVICPQGPGHEIVDWGDALVHTPKSIDVGAARILESCVDDRTVVLATVAPETALVLPWIAAAPRGMLASFGTPAVMSAWLGEHGVQAFRGALEAAPQLQLGVSGHNYASAVSDLFGIPIRRCHWVRHPIEEQPAARPQAERTLDVLVPGRLSRERWPFFAAGAAAAEALDRPLAIHGQGPDADWIRDQLAGTTKAAWTVTERGDVRERLAVADIVVAGGLTALEAVAAECILIAPIAEGAVGVGAVAAPESLTDLHESNFQVFADSPLAGTEIAQRVAGLRETDRAAMAAAVRESADPAVTLAGILHATADTARSAQPMDPKVVAAVALAQVARARDDAAAYSQARDHFRTQAANWESACSDAVDACRKYEEARDYFRGQAERWERELGAAQQRLIELEQRLAEVEGAQRR